MSSTERQAKLGTVTLLVLLTGCTVGPDYKRPDLALPASYSEGAQQGENTEAIQSDWWTLYNDPMLNQLIETALHNNRDLQQAVAQVEAAAAVLDQTSASLLPEIDFNANNARTRSSHLNARPIYPGVPAITNGNNIVLSTTFELDFWGKLRRAAEGARAKLLGSRYGHDVVALTLASTTAQSYFTLRSLDGQIAIARETLTARDDTLNVIKSRAKGGLATELDISQAQVARSDAALQLNELQRQRSLVEHQLGLLTGQPGLTLAALPQSPLPTVIIPPAGLPSTLIERRPDVRQAEQSLVAANANIGYTKAAQLPSFSLTSYYGGQSKILSDVIKNNARVWTLGLITTMPVFDAGKSSARTREAEALQRQSLAIYQKSVETAFKEVADALSNLEKSRASTNDLQAKTDAARNALRLSRLRYDSGYSGYLEVLDAQRTANGAEQALLQNQQAQLLYSIDLMKALGGGWKAEEATPVAQR